MRCYCCDKILTDFEATRRNAVTKEFLDMCTKCVNVLPVNTIDRDDLKQDKVDSVLPDFEEFDEE